ncbi:cytochrome P450 [Nocardia panacis]|uniref:Cytochrome P450 n=2 Tax=Nocardia panacis TaxID=2340916 RepID=A0A3A4K873_9NOCA|nr:cytochrome P450 [Nocardia panacis]
MLADPYPVYARLRAEDPVHWHEGLRALVLTRHADCTRVLREHGVFSADPRKLGKPIAAQVISLQTMDPPEHSIIRHHFVAALKRRDLATWAAGVAATADELVAAVGTEPFDFVADIAEPLALSAMCLLYGVNYPLDDTVFRTASRTLALGMDAGLAPERRAPALAARETINEMIRQWVSDPPRHSVLAHLDDITAVPSEHLVNSARAIFDAGYSTTANFLGNAVRWLLANGHRDALGTLDTRAVDELARLVGPVQAVSRLCLEDTEFGGRSIGRGEIVIALLGAANHDPEVFPDPQRAEFGRAPNPHLGFGRGVHSCLGSHIGNRIMVALSRSLASVRLESAGAHRQRPTATQRGLDLLPLRVR